VDGIRLERLEDDEARRARLWWFVAGAALLVAVPLAASRIFDQPPGRAHTFEIPPGTAARVAAGEDVEVLPENLAFKVRDRLVVVNHDDTVHYVGAFPIAPGQTLDKRFGDAVSLSGFCSLHASGRLTIDIGPRT
jgi:hypothetical protein